MLWEGLNRIILASSKQYVCVFANFMVFWFCSVTRYYSTVIGEVGWPSHPALWTREVSDATLGPIGHHNKILHLELIWDRRFTASLPQCSNHFSYDRNFSITIIRVSKKIIIGAKLEASKNQKRRIKFWPFQVFQFHDYC